MKIWKSVIFTLSSKRGYISLSRINQEDLLPDNVTYFTLLKRLLNEFWVSIIQLAMSLPITIFTPCSSSLLESINFTNIPGGKKTPTDFYGIFFYLLLVRIYGFFPFSAWEPWSGSSISSSRCIASCCVASHRIEEVCKGASTLQVARPNWWSG